MTLGLWMRAQGTAYELVGYKEYGRFLYEAGQKADSMMLGALGFGYARPVTEPLEELEDKLRNKFQHEAHEAKKFLRGIF